MRLYPDKLEARLKQQLDSVYLIVGPEHLLVEEACDAVRRAVRRHQIAERVVLEADARFDWNQLAAATETMSLFASRRLIELRLPGGKPGREGGAVLRDWVKKGSDDVLLIKGNAWDMSSEKTAWVKALEQAGVYLPCWTVKAHQMPQWIARRLSSRGVQADRAVVQFLADRLEGNLLAAAQEIERLALLHGPGQALTMDALRLAVADNSRFDSFRLVELVLVGQAGAALRCIRGLREVDTPMPLIVGALSRELGAVGAFQVLAPDCGAAAAFRELKVWPSRQQAVAAAAERLRADNVRLALASLSDLDQLSKSSKKRDFWVALERFSVGLATNQMSRYAA